jgi:aldose 1-epimerase
MSHLLVQTEQVRLLAGTSVLEVSPQLGGSVMSLRWDGHDILQSAPASAPKPTPPFTAGFPLIPFSGRIAQGRFHWQGHDIALPANFPPEPHNIHGQAWSSEWETVRAGRSTLEIAFSHPKGAWPWQYGARQTFLLRDDGLSVEIMLRNEDAAPMPAGIGWHPYFPAKGAVIRANTESGWVLDDEGLPCARLGSMGGNDLREPREVASLNLDHPFVAPEAETQITWPDRALAVRMKATNPFDHLVVFTPPGEDFFCVEPVSHVPNAHNLGLHPDMSGLVKLMPGDTLEGRIELSFQQL